MTLKTKFILASQSPRRRELLEKAGFSFEIMLPSETAECGICSRESTPELVARLAYQKAMDIRQRLRDRGQAETCQSRAVVACDTVADLMGRVLGKPEDRRHAEEMIRLLSGRKHSVYSGLCVLPLPDGEPLVEVAKSVLVMAQLTDAQIDEYLDSEAWFGKSGAFGYQDDHPWLSLVSGTGDNVVGLPIDLLHTLLAKLD